MNKSSRLPGFYDLSLADRWSVLVDRDFVSKAELSELMGGGLTLQMANGMVENAVGTYALPLGVALNFTVNGRDCLVPMAVEEPSVIAAASNAARIIRGSGGFLAEADEALMAAQIEVRDVEDMAAAVRALTANESELLELGRASVPRLVSRGGGPRSIEVRCLAPSILVVHVYVDCGNAMGANLVNTVAESLSEPVCRLAGGQPGLRILSNLCDCRRVRVSARIAASALATERLTGAEVAAGIAAASRFAELDPYRAATHNKGIMNGVDAVVIATGNDWRGVEAGAHAFAARSGRYRPLASWAVEDELLIGHLEMPLAVGTAGGTSALHSVARAVLRMMEVSSSGALACIAGAAGLASNFAALRALATDGIQKGHMRMHRRAVGHGAMDQVRIPEVPPAVASLARARLARAGALLSK